MATQKADTLGTALIWVGVAAMAFLLWYVRSALVIAFAAILLAIFLRAVMGVVCRVCGLSEVAGLTMAVLAVFVIFVAIFWMFGASVGGQFERVLDRVQAGQAAAAGFLNAHHLGVVAQQLGKGSGALSQAMLAKAFTTGLRILEGAIVLFISALYFAAHPAIYREGFARLFGHKLHDTVTEGLRLISTSLELWLLGQMIVMAVVGLACALALTLIGVPGAIALGMIAAIAELVPYLGPFVGAAPALFAALTLGMDAVTWTAMLYLGIHMLEGYVLSPMLQRHFLFIPPALVLIGILISGMLFGVMGIVVGAPLTATIFTAVKVFYVRDTLAEETEIPEESPL